MSAIESFMTKEMVSAAPDETVAEVARRMSKAHVGAVVIVTNGKLCGVFSERDLLTRVVAEGRDPETTSVGSVATTDLVTTGPDASIRSCAAELKNHQVRHLPVVDGDKPIGIISSRDFFAKVSLKLEDWIERARYNEQLNEDIDPYDHIGGGYGQ